MQFDRYKQASALTTRAKSIKSEVRATSLQLKRKAKLPTVIGLSSSLDHIYFFQLIELKVTRWMTIIFEMEIK